MDISLVTLVLTSLTALAAVIGPIISSIITIRSNERTKRFEIYSPQLYSAVRKFSDAYSRIPREAALKTYNEYGKTMLREKAVDAYQEFSSAAYEVISFIDDSDIHDQITNLLAELEKASFASPEYDHRFQKVMSAIAKKLSADFSPKKDRITSKAKRNSRK
ncbi:MAG: hypothetical protein IJN67_11850 [Oscillospiraceae bacterium]|nr:hypothetical protein [Oscillospiraceae bacterium]